MLNDYFWFRFFRRRRGTLRRLTPVLLILIAIAGLIYAAVFVIAATEGIHRLHGH